MSCPICDRKTDRTYRPFCSKRCADVDLGRWLKGGYSVPSVEDDSVADEDAGAEDRSDRLT